MPKANISAVGNVSRYATFNLMEGNDSFVGHNGDDYVDAGAGNDALRVPGRASPRH